LERFQLVSRLAKILIVIIAIGMAVYFALFYTRETAKLITYGESGWVASVVSGPDSVLTFSRVDTADFVAPPYPNEGDRVIAINDSSVSQAVAYREWGSPHPVGYEIRITYVSKADTLRSLMRFRPVPRETFFLQAAMMFLRFLISISYMAVGIWAFAKRPKSGAVRALALFCLAMSCFVVTFVTMLNNNYSSISIPLLDTMTTGVRLFALLFGAFWLNLQFLFPSPRSFVRKNPLTAHVLCYVPVGILGIASILTESAKISLILIGFISLQVFAGFILLRRYHGKTTEPIEKRQTRLVLWGTGIGLGAMGLFILVAIVASSWLTHQKEVYIIGGLMAVFVGLLLSPLSFAYAFGKYRLLEIEGRIRRGTRHFLIALGLLAVFYVLVYIVSESLLAAFGIESRTPVLIVALILGIGFAPAQRRLLGVLNKWIYPERYRLKRMLDEFLAQAVVTNDKETFWSALEKRLAAALKVDRIFPVLKTKEGVFVHRNGGKTPFDEECSFIRGLTKVGGRPIMHDELVAGGKIDLRPGDTEWFDTNQVALILPMVTRSELIGFLGIGFKSTSRDFEPADFEILHSLANQIAVAADNINLLEENAAKRRMEAELSFARKVQERMLPQTIPATPGLEVAAISRSCTEVAGDYFDVINVGDGRTVLAIGDVSGKGAGAALLMSNVQAALRMAVGVETRAEVDETSGQSRDIDLTKIISTINRLICGNSQSDQFITFFVAIYEPEKKELKFINAGHNPPLVLTASGNIEELSAGGVMLGAFADVPYVEGSIRLSSGDIVLLYTDGVSEAAREDDEMFGDKRIKQFLRAHRALSPRELLDGIEREAAAFAGSVPLADDVTLLVARVIDAE
jgi:serine phosphatase RsbU (regulator of sigma subunit)